MDNNIDETEYVYLIKEREFIKTKENIYKIGRTTKLNHIRFNQYPKGSILLFQIICNNCKIIEKNIITTFIEKFIQRKDIGTEYFEGDYVLMIDMIYTIVKNNNIKLCKYCDSIDTEYICDICKINIKYKYYKIIKEFPDYKNDISFGGTCKYIKIQNLKSKTILYINEDISENIKENNIEENDMINTFIVEAPLNYGLNYFDTLINDNILCIDNIYDLNSDKFKKSILKTKINFNIENYDTYIKKNIEYECRDKCHNKKMVDYMIKDLFLKSSIINNEICATVYTLGDIEIDTIKKFNKIKDFDTLMIDVGHEVYIFIDIIKINNKYYPYDFLRTYSPYLIRWNDNGDYYIINRDYTYIGTNNKRPNHNGKGYSYIFHDGNVLWNSKENYINAIDTYNKIIETNKLKKCLNINSFTDNILNLY